MNRSIGVARFFSPIQRKQVDVLFDAILPGTDTSPGAADVDAAEYLDRLLGAYPPVYYEVPALRQQYVAGLSALDAASTARSSKALAELAHSDATKLLVDLAAGELTGLSANVDGKRFFGILRNHCIEGCFADPRWGGNRGAAMWAWYGYLQPSTDFARKETDR
jgi:gluconate 2-dehydrogenase gamma chain